MQSLIDFGFVIPALSNAAGTAQWTKGDAVSGVQSTGGYWSSTTRLNFLDSAWDVFVGDGFTEARFKFATALVWPVRGGAE